jgi:hypothetical protein
MVSVKWSINWSASLIQWSRRSSGDIGGLDRGEPAVGGHSSGTPAWRRPSRLRSSPAKNVGLSLIALQLARAREME